MSPWLRFVPIFLTCALRVGPASAASAADKATAEALFDEGRTLVEAGRYAEACPKFEASQKLDPGVGTLLNLADCYEKSGKTASAWAQFREAVSAAQSAGSAERAQLARNRAEALEPKLSYLTIIANDESLVVARDGTRVEGAALGSAIPVDPGTHEIVATAPGKRKWSTIVEVAENGARVTVTVPILPEESGLSPVGSERQATGEAPVVESKDAGSTQRVLAVGAGVVGLAGVAVGTFFGLKASSDWKEAKADCDPYPYCGANGVRLENDARNSATISTIGFVVGVAGLAGGAVLWLTAPPREESAGVSLGVSPNGVLLRGRL